ncbi:MAG: ribbon-helix-helix protein, CopG family [Synechococcales cyanobacterium K32_A2020_035]|nr:ribbon-helix-helix protein, CopG family [Synechococcales cyanobacterium K32_A2020_035]
MAHLEEVESRAARLGLSRSKIIKIAVEEWLKSSTPN